MCFQPRFKTPLLLLTQTERGPPGEAGGQGREGRAELAHAVRKPLLHACLRHAQGHIFGLPRACPEGEHGVAVCSLMSMQCTSYSSCFCPCEVACSL